MSKLIDKILKEARYELPKNIKKLQNNVGWKDLDVNSIFKHKFVQKYRNCWLKLQEKYYREGGRKKYGGDFSKTGVKKKIVNINEIYPGQNGVSSEGLISKMNGEYGHESSSILPEAIMLYHIEPNKQIILLIDGHHRVAEAILKGETEIELFLKVNHFW